MGTMECVSWVRCLAVIDLAEKLDGVASVAGVSWLEILQVCRRPKTCEFTAAPRCIRLSLAAARKRAFTLIELLVVVVVLAILGGLLLNALQSSREAARRTSCINNVRQIGVAALLHESNQHFLPSGGWGYRNIGEPELGFGKSQSGGWVFSILPYMEEVDLFRLGAGMSGQSRLDANARRLKTPVVGLNCPTRRSPEAFTVDCTSCREPYGSAWVRVAARSDYAANCGNHAYEKDSENEYWPLAFAGPKDQQEARKLTRGKRWPDLESGLKSGVCFLRSEVRLAQIKDGTSKTILVGEKHVAAKQYRSGKDWSDNESMFAGFNNDVIRSTHRKWAPRRDGETQSVGSFGSAHPATFQVAFCDGSAHSVAYDIDARVFESMGDRAGAR